MKVGKNWIVWCFLFLRATLVNQWMLGIICNLLGHLLDSCQILSHTINCLWLWANLPWHATPWRLFMQSSYWLLACSDPAWSMITFIAISLGLLLEVAGASLWDLRKRSGVQGRSKAIATNQLNAIRYAIRYNRLLHGGMYRKTPDRYLWAPRSDSHWFDIMAVIWGFLQHDLIISGVFVCMKAST